MFRDILVRDESHRSGHIRDLKKFEKNRKMAISFTHFANSFESDLVNRPQNSRMLSFISGVK